MRKDLALIFIIFSTLALMVVPLSQTIIDVLLALNISLSVLLLMVAVYLKHPSDFSTFPSVILLGTAFRLALSVGTTRLILSEADAGTIIETFGDFVVRGSIAIGLVIFLIITVVQFLVVTKGAERVAEVGARFALDAMPGKQMSIDAQVRAGNMDEAEADRMRKRLDKDSQFFGAMDGAMKFVKGDAIAGLIIICINLIGGVAVGMSLHGLDFGEAVSIFTLLTVGDGLVAQIPALLMSLCAGVIVTRVANQDNEDLGTDISRELLADPRVPTLAAIIVLSIGFIPGFPTLVFTALAATLLIAGFALRRTLRITAEEEADAEAQAEDAADATTDLPISERFRLVIGTGIAASLDLERFEADLSERFLALYSARGVRFPRASGAVSEDIGEWDFVIELDEVPIYKETMPEAHVLLPGSANSSAIASLAAATTRFESAVLEGHWLHESDVDAVKELDLPLLSAEEVLSHITFRLYERNIGELFSVEVFNDFLAAIKGAEPKTMELIEEEATPAALYKLFRYLVEDGVPLRPSSLVSSALHYWIHTVENPTSIVLSECLRSSMKRQLCHRIAGENGVLGLAMVDPSLEVMAREGLSGRDAQQADYAGDSLIFNPETTTAIVARFHEFARQQQADGQQIAVVVSADLRRRFRNFLATNDIHLPVLAPHEVATEVPTLPLELLSLPQQKGAPGHQPRKPVADQRRKMSRAQEVAAV